MSERIQEVTIDGVDYKIVNSSWEDEYGSYKSESVPYKKVNGEWIRLSPECYALSQWEAGDYIPQKVIKCECCGHTTYKRFI